MITVGVDAHKRVHVALALDDAGRELAHWRGPNSVAGWEQLFHWADLAVGALVGYRRCLGLRPGRGSFLGVLERRKDDG